MKNAMIIKLSKITGILIMLYTLFRADYTHANNLPLEFKHYTISDGLSISYVKEIIRDKKGYLWIATSNGLNKFDGYDFKIYKNNHSDKNSINDNDIQCIYEDSKGNIWIGLQNGIFSKYDPITDKFNNYSYILNKSDKSNDVSINGIVEDKNGNLWIAADRCGLFCYNPTTNECYETGKGLSYNSITSLAIGKDNCIWITTWGGGFNCYDPQNKTFRYYLTGNNPSEDPRCRFLTCQFHDSDGNIWVGSSHSGLYLLETDTYQITHYDNTSGDGKGLNNETVYDIKESNDGNLWIATKNGMSIFYKNKKKFKYIVAGNGRWNLNTNIITCTCTDKSGGIWLGTNNGIYYHNPLMMKFKNYDIREWGKSENDEYIHSVIKTKSGKILVKGDNDLYIFDEEANTHKPVRLVNSRFKHIKQMTLLEDSKGNIWIGNNSEYLGKYDLETDSYEEIMMESDNKNHIQFRRINTFYEDTDGSLWIGTEIGALNYKPKENKFTALFQSKDLIFAEDKVNAILRDSYGELWFGTKRGLKRYDKDNKLIEHYVRNDNQSQSISNNTITSIYEDKDKVLWVGTQGGLHQFNRQDNSFNLITRPGKNFGDPIMGIVEDESNNLWLSSTIGIIRFNYKNNSFHVYNEADGLQSNEFNMNVFSKGRDGEIIFGGINGFNTFYPQTIKADTLVPDIYVTDFQISNQPSPQKIIDIRKKEKVVLRHWQSTFSFQFVAIDYLAPANNKYAYKLEGFNEEWVYTSSNNRIATYTNIPPGNYKFKVKASNSDEIWNEKGIEIGIEILPPIWKTWWAYMLYTIAFISIIVFIFYYYLNKEREKAKIELERLETKRQHELDELKLQLFASISHEFRTSLTLILGPLEQIKEKITDYDNKQLLEVMQRSGNRLMRLINQLLDFRKLEANKMTVKPTSQDIVSFIKEIYDIFTYHAKLKNINYHYQSSLEKLFMNFDKDKVDKIIYNLLSNAFNYTSSGGSISVILDKTYINDRMYISIEVKDSGIGIPSNELDKIFTLFYQVKDSESKKSIGTGLGLNLTKELTQIIGGQIKVESEQGKGSSFTVTIPYSEPATDVDDKENTCNYKTLKTDISEQNNCNIEKKGIILIVEDNYDMRIYTKSILSPSFNIIEAENGIEGFEKALEYIPDIIISDVMMPQMDGIELLDKIKSDERTNHIPVILVTAVNEEKQILKSLNIGVDDYITKPFSASILEARINNILTNRKKLWEKYENISKTTGENKTDSDNTFTNPFVEKITYIIRNNIANYDFSLDTLSSELCMSPSQLIRKTKAIMNITPYNLIIRMRMEYAANEIINSDKTINEIAFECGYQEKSNFSRAFTKYYGTNPLQYKKDSGKGNKTKSS